MVQYFYGHLSIRAYPKRLRSRGYCSAMGTPDERVLRSGWQPRLAARGVEVAAPSAVTVALLTICDIAKALDRAMVIGEVRLLSKTGGKSGDWKA